MSKLIVQEDGCCVWPLNRIDGYGQVSVRGKMWQVHRYLYEQLIGPIPEGMELHHECENRACANPYHLELLTDLQHHRRHAPGPKTHCPNGHAYAGGNLYLATDGFQKCRQCHRERVREQYRNDNPGYGLPCSERTHCPKGHPYSGDNLYVDPGGNRHCRECNRERCRRRKAGGIC